ncbi:uracil-DNA glycosylase [Domibacillus sp. PGB-M46]|nr:uracil-DNA glycosylase [Domibacillus sp. PGB-M46]MCI2253789.1 uracil-DNA glycosylase [Domibacillus sp. PGB-M46]
MFHVKRGRDVLKAEPNCMKCRHFFVTWDAQAPRGCRAFGFKTKQMPSVVVKRSSGHSCFQFSPKEGVKK